MVWKLLSLSSSASSHIPPILISTTFKSDAYEVHLTDLTHIWSESLDRRSIIRRSREEHASIDPSNGSQFSIFLEKLKLGLEAAPGTTLAITIETDAGRPCLVLNVTVELPGGLAPLQWPVRLSAAPQAQLTRNLVMPLLKARHVRSRELEGLEEVLREKNIVIQKLLDKLESSGTELGEVFPQAVGGKPSRKVDRKKAEERVKGLKPFDMETWRKSRTDDLPLDITQLIGQGLTHDTAQELDICTIINVPVSENQAWWESIKGMKVNLGSGTISPKSSQYSKSKTKSPPPYQPRLGQSVEDDEFQVQATPAHLVSPFEVDSKSTVEDTTDEELDESSQKSKIPDSFPLAPSRQKSASPRPVKKLGALGGKKAAAAPDLLIEDDKMADERPERVSTSSPKLNKLTVTPRKGLGQVGVRKRAPDELSSQSLPNFEGTVSESSRMKKPLGRLGGRKKEETSELPSKSDDEPTATSSEVYTSKRKIGMLGQGEEFSPVTDLEINEVQREEDARGRTAIKLEKEVTPETKENSLERANKKRETLKKDLEMKAKAPAKKKRKF